MYEAKFQKSIKDTLFDKLDKKTQEFIKTKAFLYRFSFQELKQLVDMSIDLNMWNEESIEEIWQDKANKKATFSHIKNRYQEIKTKPKSYQNFNAPTPKDNKISFIKSQKESLGLGRCPVASKKTRCCNLLTLDAVESCGFDCSYCSIQSFYNQKKIGFDTDFVRSLKI